MRTPALIASSVLLLASSTALAEGPQQPPPPPPQEQVAPPPQQPYPQQPAPQQPAPQQPAPQQYPPQEAEPDPQQGRGIEYGFHVLVPIWVTDEGAFDPGIGITGRIGWEFAGGLTAELNLGWMVNGLADVDASVDNFWLGAGARYSFFNPSAFVPFVGAGLKINLWGVCIYDDLTGTTFCGDERKVTLGFIGTAGAAYEFSRWAAIEFGVNLDYTLPGDAFAEAEMYVSPFVGGTLYY